MQKEIVLLWWLDVLCEAELGEAISLTDIDEGGSETQTPAVRNGSV